MKSLNTEPTLIVHQKLISQFKTWLKDELKEKLPSGFNLHGYDLLFKVWLKAKGIPNLDQYLQGLSVTFNRFDFYKQKGKYLNNKTV